MGTALVTGVSGDTETGMFDVTVTTDVYLQLGMTFNIPCSSSSSILSSSALPAPLPPCEDPCVVVEITHVIYVNPYVWIYLYSGCYGLWKKIVAGDIVRLTDSLGFTYDVEVDSISIISDSGGLFVIRATDAAFPQGSDFVSLQNAECAPTPEPPDTCTCCDIVGVLANLSGNQSIQFTTDLSDCNNLADIDVVNCLTGKTIVLYEPGYMTTISRYNVVTVAPQGNYSFLIQAYKISGGIPQNGFLFFLETGCYSRGVTNCCSEFAVNDFLSTYNPVILVIDTLDSLAFNECDNLFDLLDENHNIISPAPVSYNTCLEMWSEGKFYWHTEWTLSDFDQWASVKYIQCYGCSSSSSISSSGSCSSSTGDVLIEVMKTASRTYQIPGNGSCSPTTMRLYDFTAGEYVFDWVPFQDHFSVLEDGIYRLEVKCSNKCPAYYIVVDIETMLNCYNVLYNWVKCNPLDICDPGCNKLVRERWVKMINLLEKFLGFFGTLQSFKMLVYSQNPSWYINDLDEATEDDMVVAYTAVHDILMRCGCNIDDFLNCR
jgi:hypothetical protein